MPENKSDLSSVDRRSFLAGGALLGFSYAAGISEGAGKSSAILNSDRPDAAYTIAAPENVLYTSCLQCNTGCGVKCKIQDGVVTKIDGNPYSPWTMLPHLSMKTDVRDAVLVDGAICPKGHAGIQTAYDPYRIRKVLKRAGKRGENKWITIPFEKAVEEICEGGLLFKSVQGEENRNVEGIKSLMALKEPDISKEMAKDIKAYWDEKDKDKKSALLAEFKVKFRDHLDKLIDPEHPDLGPKNNQIVISWGRLKGGRADFYRRFADALGSTNAHGHTTVCQGSLYFTGKALSEQYEEGKFTGGKKFYWQADTENSKFVLFVGANLFEANYGPTNRAVRLTANLASGKTKIAVADPRFSKLAGKAWKWLPVKPGTDAALAMAMMRWMVENNKYDAKFLSCANKAAAREAGETSWTNASWLVEVKDGKPGKFIRAADIGIAKAEKRKTKDDKDYEEKFLVVMVNGKPTAFDPNDEKTPVVGDLMVSTALPDGTQAKSGFAILAEEVMSKSIAEWCQISDIKADDAIAIARELASGGKQAAVDIHRGVSQHTNGFYNVFAWYAVNMLLGNFDHKGGMIKASTYDTMGKGELFKMDAHPGKTASFGVSSIRHGVAYEKTSIFAGYPARRNWYPNASDVYQEIIPSIGDAYPYPAKVIFMYMGAPTYSLPAGQTNIEILCDTAKVPLFITCDILVGMTSMYSDYIFPDLSYLERWEFQGSHPCVANKVQPVRQPVIAPITEECQVYGAKAPICFETMMLGIAERLALPGFGDNGLGDGKNLKHPDDFYMRCLANLAFGEKPDASGALPDASAEEIGVFMNSRKHLPKTIFDAERWKSIIGDAVWPKVVYLLNRGGRFEDHAKGYKEDMVAHPYGALINFYQEKTAGTVHSGTGKKFPGYPKYIPIQDYLGHDLKEQKNGYDLAMITHRVISQTKSRTVANPWLMALMPENGVLINKQDADKLGFKAGDMVRLSSATNKLGEWMLGAGNKKPMTGKIIVTQAIRPGVISFALGFGNWATGSADIIINGQTIKGESDRSAGLHANAAMLIDPALKNTCLLDPHGGSVSFYDSHVRLDKA
ncbi:MAG: molybdopterin-dependent oxidoreductase [Nitrospinae bacterium]|nr:molybdopterin-dependent oxidoreductase [Nitrospinota bacterium]MBF0634378.1 molybdopterin-dependent oxidoreductase [Nitrospinota bacterium]